MGYELSLSFVLDEHWDERYIRIVWSDDEKKQVNDNISEDGETDDTSTSLLNERFL